jgi:hypothetical protein
MVTKKKGSKVSRNNVDFRKESTSRVDMSVQNQAVTEISLRDTSSQTMGWLAGRQAGRDGCCFATAVDKESARTGPTDIYQFCRS